MPSMGFSARRLAMGAFGTVRYCPAYPQATACQLGVARTVLTDSPGQHFPEYHPVDLRPRDPGHLGVPSTAGACCRLSRKGSAQHGTGQRGDASQPRCEAASPYSSRPTSLLGLRSSNSVSTTPTGRLPGLGDVVCQGLLYGVSSGALDQRSSGVRCRPGCRRSDGRTMDFAGLACLLVEGSAPYLFSAWAPKR